MCNLLPACSALLILCRASWLLQRLIFWTRKKMALHQSENKWLCLGLSSLYLILPSFVGSQDMVTALRNNYFHYPAPLFLSCASATGCRRFCSVNDGLSVRLSKDSPSCWIVCYQCLHQKATGLFVPPLLLHAAVGFLGSVFYLGLDWTAFRGLRAVPKHSWTTTMPTPLKVWFLI